MFSVTHFTTAVLLLFATVLSYNTVRCLPRLFTLLNGLVYDPVNMDQCPQLTGQEELRQMARFWMNHNGIPLDSGATMEQVATRISAEYVENPASFRGPIKLNYEHTRDLVHGTDGIHLRMVLTEYNTLGYRSSGGSSFRTVIQGSRTKAMCPYRDYFNGTYLICCKIVEDMSNLTVTHEYGNFSAYEVYVEGPGSRSKRNHTHIWSETITLPGHYSLAHDAPIVNKHDESYGHYTQCDAVDFERNNGHWIIIDEQWKWVIEGCKFQWMRAPDVQKCIYMKFNNQFYVFGDYHMRNLFYYVVHEMIKDFDQYSKIHGKIDVNEYHYRWSTSAYVLEDYLEDFLGGLKHSWYNQTTGGRRSNYKLNIAPKNDPNDRILLMFNLGIWPVLSRPLADYFLAIDNIVEIVKEIVELNVTVVYQDLPASPSAPYKNQPNPSNHLYAALNYYACTKLKAVGVTCAPSWRHTMPWINDLICASNTHTMCYDEDSGKFEVVPAGHVTSQYILRTACSPS